MKTESYDKNRAVVVILIFIFALTLRVYVSDFDKGIPEYSDGNAYHFSAENILKYKTITNDRDGEIFNGKIPAYPSNTIQPGYPIFLAIVYFFFGDSFRNIVITNIISSLITMFLIYKILREFKLSNNTIYVVLCIVAIYPGFIYNLDVVLTENIYITTLLFYVYYTIKYLNSNKKIYLIISIISLILSSYIRANALPFIAMSCYLVFTNDYKKQDIILSISIIIIICISLMLPWWIRNYIHFKEFYLFTLAGENPKIWGATPYFIDIYNNSGNTLTEIAKNNYEVNPFLYMKWRICGVVQYMWYDIWDEQIVHPVSFLRPFLFIHQLIIVPMLILIPKLIYKKDNRILFIASIPILTTIINMFFHGLPRYVYPTIPYILILFGIFINKFKFDKNHISDTKNKTVSNTKSYGYIFKIGYFIALFGSCIFSIVLIYSVYFFSYDIVKEMSEYRLNKYIGIGIEDIKDETKILEINRNIKEMENLTLENYDAIDILNNGVKIKGYYGSPLILKINDIELVNNNSVVTEINLNCKGGYFFDYMTVYWAYKDDNTFSESKVYRFPVNNLQSQNTIYIEGDISDLMIVPRVFTGTEVNIKDITIQKYRIESKVE